MVRLKQHVIDAVEVEHHGAPFSRVSTEVVPSVEAIVQAISLFQRPKAAAEGYSSLPFLPSVDSAFSLGYRRMVINPGHTDAEVVTAYLDRVLFIAGGYGGSVDDLFMDTVRPRGFQKMTELLDEIIAILGVTRLKTSRLETSFADMYVPNGEQLKPGERFSAVLKLLREHRVLRAEDHLSELLDQSV